MESESSPDPPRKTNYPRVSLSVLSQPRTIKHWNPWAAPDLPPDPLTTTKVIDVHISQCGRALREQRLFDVLQDEYDVPAETLYAAIVRTIKAHMKKQDDDYREWRRKNPSPEPEPSPSSYLDCWDTKHNL